jgi:hypothetical protein
MPGGKSPSLRRALFPLTPRPAIFGVLSPVNQTGYVRMMRKKERKIRQIKANVPNFAVETAFV